VSLGAGAGSAGCAGPGPCLWGQGPVPAGSAGVPARGAVRAAGGRARGKGRAAPGQWGWGKSSEKRPREDGARSRRRRAGSHAAGGTAPEQACPEGTSPRAGLRWGRGEAGGGEGRSCGGLTTHPAPPSDIALLWGEERWRSREWRREVGPGTTMTRDFRGFSPPNSILISNKLNKFPPSQISFAGTVISKWSPCPCRNPKIFSRYSLACWRGWVRAGLGGGLAAGKGQPTTAPKPAFDFWSL